MRENKKAIVRAINAVMCCNFEGMLPEDLFDVNRLSNTLEKIKLVKPTDTTYTSTIYSFMNVVGLIVLLRYLVWRIL